MTCLRPRASGQFVCQAKDVFELEGFKAHPGGIYVCAAVDHKRPQFYADTCAVQQLSGRTGFHKDN